jgi:hypothetical protein
LSNIVICGKEKSLRNIIRYALFEYKNLKNYYMDNFVFLESEENGNVLYDNSVFIFDGQNKKTIRFLEKLKVCGISCGTSEKDTLSLASISENLAVVSLQRKIVTLDRKVLEPHDFVVKFSLFKIKNQYTGRLHEDKLSLEIYPLLALAGVLLLLGYDSMNGYKL